MKFWQLESVCRWHGGTALSEELRNPRWSEFNDIYQNYETVVMNQDRNKLDMIVPSELVESVLAKLRFRFTVKNGCLRIAGEEELAGMSALDISILYGGEIIEEVLEKGSAKVFMVKS